MMEKPKYLNLKRKPFQNKYSNCFYCQWIVNYSYQSILMLLVSMNQKPKAKNDIFKLKWYSFIAFTDGIWSLFVGQMIVSWSRSITKIYFRKSNSFFLLRDDERSWPIGDGFFVVLVSTLINKTKLPKTSKFNGFTLVQVQYQFVVLMGYNKVQ
jgi:hypothetical protein